MTVRLFMYARSRSKLIPNQGVELKGFYINNCTKMCVICVVFGLICKICIWLIKVVMKKKIQVIVVSLSDPSRFRVFLVFPVLCYI